MKVGTIEMKRVIRKLKWEIRMICGKESWLFPIYFRIFERKWFQGIYEKQPEIVIEGFGGSANSFAVYAFRSAQASRTRIAHHLHITAQVKSAVKNRVPVLIIIRNPVDAVSSLLSRDYYPSPVCGLKHYCMFYEDIEQLKDQVVLATFEQLTGDMASVVKAVNEKYSLNFSMSQDMGDKGLESLNKEGLTDRAALPSEERTARKLAAKELMSTAENSVWWARALELYMRMTTEAPA